MENTHTEIIQPEQEAPVLTLVDRVVRSVHNGENVLPEILRYFDAEIDFIDHIDAGSSIENALSNLSIRTLSCGLRRSSSQISYYTPSDNAMTSVTNPFYPLFSAFNSQQIIMSETQNQFERLASRLPVNANPDEDFI